MILELKGIYKDYQQGKMIVPVLKDVNFSMEEGEYVAIMGPSGSGKSTLMNIIGCLDQATKGTFFLDGQDISKCSENEMSDIRLAKNPKLLLCDEPTGALDSKSGRQVMELFQKLNDEGVSVLMITHDPDIAAHAKRVVMIRDGELQEKR